VIQSYRGFNIGKNVTMEVLQKKVIIFRGNQPSHFAKKMGVS
jgi:hypothetical protein